MALSIPALNQLRCFQVAARHESFTLAADELCLTPSAVSHQIRTLETTLGVDLFVRLGRKMFLSELGRRYLDDIQPAFALIEAGTRRLTSATPRDVLTIAVAPSFAEAWLVPNLARFIAVQPDIEVRLVTLNPALEGDTGRIDCEIRYGHGKWVGVSVEKIAEDTLVPLASPALLARSGPIEDLDALWNQPLIHTESRQLGWDAWFRSAGVSAAEVPLRLRVDRSPLAIRAAVNGLGIALESRILAAREIAEGALVPLERLASLGRGLDETYFLLHARARDAPAKVVAFADWLRRDIVGAAGALARHA